MTRKKERDISSVCGKRIKQVCKDQGIKQYELANTIGIAATTLSGIIRGDYNLTPNVAKRIENAYPQYPAQWLLGFGDLSTPDEIAYIEKSKQFKAALEAESHNRNVLDNFLRIVDSFTGHSISIETPNTNHDDYKITAGKEILSTSARDIFLMADNVTEYTMFIIEEYVKNRKRRYI